MTGRLRVEVVLDAAELHRLGLDRAAVLGSLAGLAKSGAESVSATGASTIEIAADPERLAQVLAVVVGVLRSLGAPAKTMFHIGPGPRQAAVTAPPETDRPATAGPVHP